MKKYLGNIGIMEKKMETIGMNRGLNLGLKYSKVRAYLEDLVRGWSTCNQSRQISYLFPLTY